MIWFKNSLSLLSVFNSAWYNTSTVSVRYKCWPNRPVRVLVPVYTSKLAIPVLVQYKSL